MSVIYKGGRELHDVGPGPPRRRADGAVERERVDLEVVVVREFDVELEDAVGAPHLRERNRGAAAGFDARVRSSLALAGDGAAVGLRGETEAVLGRPRGAAHAAAARRGARPADGRHSGERRVTELERRVTGGARTADGGHSWQRRVAELTTVSG